MSELDEQSRVRRDKLLQLREKNLAYPHNVVVSHTSQALLESYNKELDANALLEAGSFSIAGRISFLRSFGKAGFVKIRDRAGMIQIHVSKDKLEEASFKQWKSSDLGDIVRAEGTLFRTQTGELTLEAVKFETLNKCLYTPPEKFHGLSDQEERYRKRYVDLMSNEETRKVFSLRSKMVQGIRDYFLKKDFLEVETPMMHSLVSGATAKPFSTHHNTLDMELFLRIAPELHLKRLVVGGLERVFEINRNFRNEGISPRHNPEFTMLEFYMAYANYHTLMDMTEELVRDLFARLSGGTQVEYQGEMIDYGAPWARLSMEYAVKSLSGFKGELQNKNAMISYLKEKGVELTGREGTGVLLSLIFEEDVEAQLRQPTFITGFPTEISPLARRSDEKSPAGFDVSDRFELYIVGVEIANGFNELNDPDDQRERFLAQVKEKEAGNEEACDFDEDYIRALEYGLPPTAGEGIGIDRLAMLLTDSASIRDVILFPQMRKD